MYFILEGDDKLKHKINEYVRVCLLIIIITLIGIGYTIYYAFQHNGQVVYQAYGINQIVNVNPSLSLIQIIVIILLGLGLVGAIVFLAYSRGGKIKPEQLLESEEKSIFFALETILLTILLTLIIVIPTNILLEKYNTSNNYQNTTQANSDTVKYNNSYNPYN